MNDDSKVHVTKEEVGKAFNLAEASIKELSNLLDRIRRYSNWSTNISMALLGFYLAILIQLKFKEEIPYLSNAILILCLLCTSILIGFYLKVRYEVMDWYGILKEELRNLGSFLNRVHDIFEQKGVSIGDKVNFNISSEKLEKTRKRYPINLIFFQFILLFISVLQITYYLIRYLFFE